jgi:hypothetical protein
MKQSLFITSIVVAGALSPACESPPQRQHFAPADKVGPDAPKINPPGPVDVRQSALITFPCGADDSDGNHMDSRPASGCSNGVASDQYSRNGMEYFQRFRQHLGIECLLTPDYAQEAAGWHAIYMAEHSTLFGDDCYMDGHSEKPGCRFFTGRSPQDQQISAGMDTNTFMHTGQVTGSATACRLEPTQFIAGMLAGPYHRMGMMDTRTDAAGYATFWRNHSIGLESWANVITMSGARFSVVGTTRPTAMYPVPGDSNVPRYFTGIETPTPPAPPEGWKSGYPVSIFRPDTTFSGTALCRVESDGTCAHVPHVALLNSNDPHVRTPPEGAHIYAFKPLASNTVYRAQFFGSSAGTDVAPWWEFRTKN